jgi:SAM-dependent methyltransferase
MDGWFRYIQSDFDEGAHKAALRLDLQDIDLPDASVDLILTPHVLEHVPDTDAALRELRRVVAPGGRVALQVPMLQGETAPPTAPEFHGDNTPVFWRFGFDLADRLRAVGFETRLACLPELLDLQDPANRPAPGEVSGEFDLDSMLRHLRPGDLEPVSTREEAERFGFEPAYQLLTWICDVPKATATP